MGDNLVLSITGLSHLPKHCLHCFKLYLVNSLLDGAQIFDRKGLLLDSILILFVELVYSVFYLLFNS